MKLMITIAEGYSDEFQEKVFVAIKQVCELIDCGIICKKVKKSQK